MKKILSLFAFVFCTVLSHSQCLPTVTNSGPTGDYIASFMINSLNQVNSGDAVCDYEITDTTTTTMSSGQTYTFQVVFGAGANNQYVGLWIDLNGNGVLDASEMLYASSAPTSAPSTVIGTIVIPTATITGRVSLRVCTKRDSAVLSTEACTLNSYGEYQDYFIVLNQISICSGTPNPGATLAMCCPGTPFQLYKISVAQNEPVNYSWESSPNNIVWTPIPNTNHEYYNPSVSSTANLCYRCLATCSSSNLSSFSIPGCSPCNPLSTATDTRPEQVSIHPNPFVGPMVVEIESNNSGSVYMVWVNAMGEVLKEIHTTLREGNNKIEVETDPLAPGIYDLRITGANRITRHYKIIKSF